MTAQDELNELSDKLAKNHARLNSDLIPLLDCPDCPNQGWYPEYDRNGIPAQVQCEFCYTEPRSKFYVENNLGQI